jgi:Animal haem peroxidase
MSGKHGVPLRGLQSAKASQLFQGRFGRMFRSIPAAGFGEEHAAFKVLTKLGAAMTNTFDRPKDGKDDEESGIPALYTYFGQFVDHDITFDPASSLQKQDDPDALTDYRSPALDMDNVYGRGPDDQPYMYDNSGTKFLLGNPIHGGDPGAHDLARNSGDPARALIGDPRNDENSIVSQFQGLVHRFHNRMVEENPGVAFTDIQQLVRFHYQYVVLNDFLPRIVSAKVLEDLKTDGQFEFNKLKFFHWKNDPFMPVEFSVAAYRLGHSMIRPGYRLNDKTLLPIFPIKSHRLDTGLTGFQAMIPTRGIDWGRFIDLDIRAYDGGPAIRKKRLQFAYRIDTSIVMPLKKLPESVASDPPPALAERNLLRGWRLGLPSGQDVARAMGLIPLDDKDILIGQGVDKPDKPLGNVTDIDPIFTDNCPLWTYILAEAMRGQILVKIPVKEDKNITTPQLGPVGGRIVAEVFLGLMFGDNNSMLSLNPHWKPPKFGPNFALRDFVAYALGRKLPARPI